MPTLCCFTESGRDGDRAPAMKILQSKYAGQTNPPQNAKHVAVFSFEQATMSLLKLISISARKTLILKRYFS